MVVHPALGTQGSAERMPERPLAGAALQEDGKEHVIPDTVLVAALGLGPTAGAKRTLEEQQ